MASSRRYTNGISPLVNQRRQITSFFSKINSPSPTLAKQASKINPNRRSSTSPSPTTPSPFQSKLKNPLLVLGQTPSLAPSTPAGESYGKEVVEKRIGIYCPSDKEWYEGVKSFDEESGNHLVQYDDAEEEELDLRKEKIEWVKETTGRFKRLRRGFSSSFKNVKEESDENDDDYGGDDDDEKDEEEEKEDKLEENGIKMMKRKRLWED